MTATPDEPRTCPSCGRVRRSSLGTAIRLVRKRLALNQTKFSERLFIHQNSVSRIEEGGFTPRPKILLLILGMAETQAEKVPIIKALEKQGVDVAAIRGFAL